MRSARRARWLGVALAIALVIVQAALAEPPVVRLDLTDQAAARRAVIKLGDLAQGWKGGGTKPNLPDETCAGYNPKRSDLLVTGVAESRFTAPLLYIASNVMVMKTPRMAELHWQRTVLASGFLACLREDSASEPGSKTISVKRMPFPKLAPRVSRTRTVIEVTGANGSVRMALDLIVLSRGRTELTLGFGAPYRSRAEIEEFEVRLAKLMLSRTPA